MSLFFRRSVIAATGLFLGVFLMVHLSANALLLLPEASARTLYNSYSSTLRESTLVSIVAYLLYLSIILHVIYAGLITFKNRRFKRDRYLVDHKNETSSWASQNMGVLG
ncbi:MAG: succinate dehydrogenase, partial [Xanthomarina sp.]